MDHSAKHTGIDLAFAPGTRIASPMNGIVMQSLGSAGARSACHGLVVRSTEVDGSTIIRLLGIRPAIKAGQAVRTGDLLGVSQNAADDLPGLRPYLHVEVYKIGRRIDPTDWMGASLAWQ